MKHYLLSVTLACITLSACQAKQTEAITSQVASAHAASPQTLGGEISISDPYVLPPFPGRDVAAGFFKIKNNGATDRLISASSPDSAAVEIHNHIEDDGVMRMRKVDAVPLNRGDSVRFEPGSYHLMLFGVNFAEDQDEIDVTLNYENAGSITLTVPIVQHGDTPPETSNSDASNSKGSGSHFGSGTKAGDEPRQKKAYGSGH